MSARIWLGGMEVTVLVDGVYSARVEHLVHMHGPEQEKAAREKWGKPTFEVDVNCFLVKADGALTLIDAGAGEAWGPAYGKMRASLAALGVQPGDIDRVLLTHVHGDHALGLLTADGHAWLPQAEIFAPRADWDYFTDSDEMARLPSGRRGGAAVAAKLDDAYGARIRLYDAGDTRAGIESVGLPGHTPGQCGFILRGGGETLFLVADALHVGDLQAADPDLGVVYDISPSIAAATRRAMLARAADEGLIVAGGHLHGLARVRRAGDGFAFEPLTQ